MAEPMPAFCPACDNEYDSMADVKAHMLKALKEPDAADYETHKEIYYLEGWDEVPVVPT